jgi:hypothetical protein
MGFLIRAAFWLMIIVLLLPTDEKQRSEVYGTAQAAFKDLASFCDRNPDACAEGKDVLAVFVQKAEFGMRMVTDLVNGRTEVGEGDTQGSDTQDILELPPSDAPSQDTLNPGDRAESWSGPGAPSTSGAPGT